MKKLIFVITFAFATHTLYAQVKTRSYIIDPQLAPREHNVDFKHMILDVSFDPSKGLVKGKVTHVFSPLRQQVDSIWLDATDMKFSSVKINGKDVKYKRDSLGILIYCNQSLVWQTTDTLTVVYECTPKKGLYFVGWNDSQNLSRKQIWSQGQGIDNRCWIPMYDEMNDKMTTETFVKFDKTYKVLSNGQFLETKDNKDGTLTWHYKMTHPHSPYLVMIGIGKYEIKETKSKSGVPMHLWYYPEWKSRVEATYKYSEQMIDFYEKEFGVKYPWESFSQIPVQDFMYGAMENTTCVLYGDFLFCDDISFNDRNYVGVNAHELMHQWFGDYVTARSDAHHWLQESFATYGNMLFEREVFGQDYFDWSRRNAQNASVDESKQNKFQVAHSEAGSTRHYPKGATVLNMLKYVLGGRDVYNLCIKHYLETHPYSNVDTHDLLIAFEDVTGMQLDWFFEEWIYKGGEPDYKISFEEINGNAVFTVTQVQELSALTGLPESGGNAVNAVSTDPFVGNTGNNGYRAAGLWKMPIWFEVHYADGTVDKKQAWIENQTETVKIANTSAKKIDFALFDPNNEVMKSVSFDKSFDMLKSQALKSAFMLDRYDAISAMNNTSVETKRDFLIAQFEKETSLQIKNEIVNQLIKDKNAKSYDLIRKAIADKDVQVQKNVVGKTEKIPTELISDYEKLLTGNSYDLIENTLDKLCESNAAKTQTYLDVTKNTEGTLGKNVKIKWLEIASESDTKYITELVNYSGPSYEFRTRINAFASLKKLNYMNIQLVANMIDAIWSPNGRLGTVAGGVLKYFYEQQKNKKIIDDYIGSKNPEAWQHDKIFNYLK